MFKKTMTFDNLDGEEVKQTFYFHYSKKEVAELLEFGAIQKTAKPGKTYLPLEQALKVLGTPTEESGLSQVDNNRQAYEIFQDLILDAYGEKGADNVTFVKNERTRSYWESHVAFVEMIFEFLENPDLAAQFIESCLPPKLVAAAKAEEANNKRLTSADIHDLSAEAARRQQDPTTRIEPGVIPEDADPNVVGLAQVAAKTEKTVDYQLLTEAEILAMDDVAFNKLDPQKLSKPQMMAAFRRKSSS